MMTSFAMSSSLFSSLSLLLMHSLLDSVSFSFILTLSIILTCGSPLSVAFAFMDQRLSRSAPNYVEVPSLSCLMDVHPELSYLSFVDTFAHS